MATVSLPLIHLGDLPEQRPIAQPASPLEMLGQMMGIKNAQQEQQLRAQQMQTGQIQQQGAQLELQQQQQAMKDQQAFRTAMQAPDNQGKTVGNIADVLAHQGAISMQTWQNLKKADMEQRMQNASLTDTQLKNNKETTAQLQSIYNNGMAMMPEDFQKSWPQLVAQISHIPGTQQMNLDPNQPMTQDQLSHIGPFLAMHNQYLDEELGRRQKQADLTKTQTENQVAQQQLQWGGNQQYADSRYRFIEQQRALGIEPSPEDAAFEKAYTKQKLMVPQATAQVRIEGLGNVREYPVFDNVTKTTVMMNANDLNAANHDAPGRYTAPGYTPEALGQRGTTEYFTKGKGGQQITAYNTALKHLDTLDSLATSLGNSNVQVFNKAAQAWAEQTGNPAPSNFAAAKNAMSGEVAAALKASGATDQEIANVGQTFNRAQSPAQLRGAIGTYRALLQSKAQQLQGQYEQGMHGKPNFGGPEQTPQGQQPGSSNWGAQFGGVNH